MDSLSGQRLASKYDLRGEIGRGGMGAVYRAFDVSLPREVALKVLPSQLAFDPLFVRRFEQEAIVAASLHHPNVVTIHDVGAQNDIHFIVMQLLEGVTLEQWIEASTAAMPLTQVNHILHQIADALDYAHDQGVAHRDIKPSTIMLRKEGHVTLMDFGLVRANEGLGLTRSGLIVGTPEYMSPEQALDQPVDGRTDIYAVGVVLFRLLTGRIPFSRSTPVATILAHVNTPPPTIRSLCPDLPNAWDTYYLDMTAPHTIEVRLGQIPSNNNYHLYLFDSGRVLRGYSGNPGNQDELIAPGPVFATGRYYVRVQRVTGFSRTQPYALTATYR